MTIRPKVSRPDGPWCVLKRNVRSAGCDRPRRRGGTFQHVEGQTFLDLAHDLTPLNMTWLDELGLGKGDNTDEQQLVGLVPAWFSGRLL